MQQYLVFYSVKSFGKIQQYTCNILMIFQALNDFQLLALQHAHNCDWLENHIGSRRFVQFLVKWNKLIGT